jgi:hypothetical protein
MLRHNLLIMFRNIRRKKSSSFIVLITVGIQAIKAVLTNPVEALKYE